MFRAQKKFFKQPAAIKNKQNSQNNRYFLSVFLIFLLFFSYPLAQETSEKNEGVSGQVESTNFYQDPTEEPLERQSEPFLLLRTIFILIAFIALAYGILRFLRSKQNKQIADNPFVKVITDFPLSVNKQLKIIQVVNDFYLLGVSQEQISLIDKLTDKEAIDLLKLEKAKDVSSATFFQDVFSKYVGIKKVAPLSMTKRLRDRIGKMK